MMKKFLGTLGGTLTMVLTLALAGCATSEQKAASNIDFTPQIIQQASDLIAADRELSRFPIVVDGFHGDMRLKGEVASDAQKSRAERMVWTARGVRSVKNDLDVMPHHQPP
jgi:hypothetical protein